MSELTNLVDINDVVIDTSLPKAQRVEEFRRQIKDPNHFMCGKYEVTVSHAENGLSLEECLVDIFI